MWPTPPRLRTAAAPLVLVAALALAGCSGSDGPDDKAELCARALDSAGFLPDLSNPAATVADARRKAGELRSLADQTTDATLQRELRETADSLETLKESDVDPIGAGEWAGRQLEQVEQLRQACQ